MTRNVCALLVALAACGAKARAPETHQIEIHSMQYVPAELVVAVGDTVVWTNKDVLPHTVTSVGEFDSQLIAAQQSWRYTVTSAGELPYVCTYHPTMRAKLIAR